MTLHFRCPVCAAPLSGGKTLVCPNRHSFDRARCGYVNLLLSNASKTQHGDDRAMVAARRAFLERGYYRPILRAVLDAATPCCPAGCRVLDAGCGEGWYTAELARALTDGGLGFSLLGVDISKEALRAAAGRLRMYGVGLTGNFDLAVASVFHLPVADRSCDLVLSLFAPCAPAEFARVLTPNGVLLRVVPAARHLWSLKRAVYGQPYENDEDDGRLEGFSPAERVRIRERLELDRNEDVRLLFAMTPYSFKTSPSDLAKLEKIHKISVELACDLLLYRKLAEFS